MVLAELILADLVRQAFFTLLKLLEVKLGVEFMDRYLLNHLRLHRMRNQVSQILIFARLMILPISSLLLLSFLMV